MQFPDPKVVVTGRVKRYLIEPEKGTLPPSCAMYVYKNDLREALPVISKYLRFGAGVKVPLDNFEAIAPLPAVKWGFYLSPDHPDFESMTDEQSALFIGGFTPKTHTIITVADSMEGDRFSIENSWVQFIDALCNGESVVVDLSALRPAGSTNSVGLVATGALGTTKGVAEDEQGVDSFLSIYAYIADHLASGDIVSLMKLLGQLCRVLRRGGAYKNGIVCTSLRWDHSDIVDYLNVSINDLPGGQRKAVRLTPEVLQYSELVELIVWSVNTHSTFLEKIVEPNLYLNVCSGILLRDRGACLLAYANLGKCNTYEDIVNAYVNATKFICELHVEWRDRNPEKSSVYRGLADDQQVGVGWLGLANLLRRWGVSYRDLINAFAGDMWAIMDALFITEALTEAYEEAAKVARSYGITRFATIEPNQSVYTYPEQNDLDGFAACRNIDPPFARRERRQSDTVGSKWYNHGAVEVLGDLTHDERQQLWEGFQELAEVATGGMTHAQSFDLTRYIDSFWLKDFITRSPLRSTYYQQAGRVNQTYLNKGQVVELTDEKPQVCSLEVGCSSCGE